MSSDKDEWKREVARCADLLGSIATIDYLDTHPDDDIKESYDAELFRLYFAAYNYQNCGGAVVLNMGRPVASAMRYGTMANVCPVSVDFTK